MKSISAAVGMPVSADRPGALEAEHVRLLLFITSRIAG
jgi:hypothetical protein